VCMADTVVGIMEAGMGDIVMGMRAVGMDISKSYDSYVEFKALDSSRAYYRTICSLLLQLHNSVPELGALPLPLDIL
jgi:hypothetical protein